jgi:type IV pilus assembly protein PilW
MQNSIKNSERGFTLVELLIAMAISLVVLTSLSSAFISQRKIYDAQEQVTEMIQGARGAMDIISREIRMAGYAPTGYDSEFESDPTASQTSPMMQRTDPTSTRFVGIPYSTSQLGIGADLNGDGVIDATNENLNYTYNGTDHQIIRSEVKIVSGTATTTDLPLSENIQSFTFQYYDSDGNATTTTADIRQIDIKITARTSKPDPNYGQNSGYRTYTLSTYVTPPNLDL